MTAQPKAKTTAQRAVEYADALKKAGYEVCAVKIKGREIEVVTAPPHAHGKSVDLVRME